MLFRSIQSYTGSWHAVFMVAAVTNVLVGMTALFVVKPMRMARREREIAPMPRVAAPVAE